MKKAFSRRREFFGGLDTEENWWLKELWFWTARIEWNWEAIINIGNAWMNPITRARNCEFGIKGNILSLIIICKYHFLLFSTSAVHKLGQPWLYVSRNDLVIVVVHWYSGVTSLQLAISIFKKYLNSSLFATSFIKVTLEISFTNFSQAYYIRPKRMT